MSSDTVEKRFKEIVEKLTLVITVIDDLLEDPLFLDNIHGEQEVSLDWTMEMLDGLKAKFEPAPPKASIYPITMDDSYDAE